MQERHSGRKVTDSEARWIAQVEVGNAANLERVEGSIGVNKARAIPPSPTEITQFLTGLVFEKKKLTEEKSGLRGVAGAGERRHELAERIQQIKLDINAIKRRKKKLKV